MCWGASSRDVPDRTDRIHAPWESIVNSGTVRLIVGLELLLAVAVLAVLVQWHYGIDVRAVASYPNSDGWCDPVRESVGGHCWGDFAAIRFNQVQSLPSEAEALYPMSTRVPRLPFMVIEDAYGFRWAVAAWSALLTACLVGPIVWATARFPRGPRLAAILVVGVVAMPTLVVIDRGNVIGLSVPCLVLAAVGVLRDRPVAIMAGVILATAVKPQFAVLIVILLALRRWWSLLATLAGIVVVQLLPPLVMGGIGLGGVTLWVTESLAWSGEKSVSDSWPINVGFARVIYLIGQSVNAVAGEPATADAVKLVASVGSVVVFVGTMALLSWRGGDIPPFLLIASMYAVASLSLPVSYAYYLSFAVALAAIVLCAGTSSLGLGVVGRPSWGSLVAGALCASLSVLVVPAGAMVGPSLTPLLASALWLTLVLAVWWNLAFRVMDRSRNADDRRRGASSGTAVEGAT